MLRLRRSRRRFGLCFVPNIIYASHALSHLRTISLACGCVRSYRCVLGIRTHTHTRRELWCANRTALSSRYLYAAKSLKIYDLSMSHAGKSLRVLVRAFSSAMFAKQEKDRFSFCLSIPLGLLFRALLFKLFAWVCACVRQRLPKGFSVPLFWIANRPNVNAYSGDGECWRSGAIFGWFNEFVMYLCRLLDWRYCRTYASLRHIAKSDLSKATMQITAFRFNTTPFCAPVFFFQTNFDLAAMCVCVCFIASLPFVLRIFLSFDQTNISCDDSVLAYTKVYSLCRLYDKWANGKNNSTFLPLLFNGLPFDSSFFFASASFLCVCACG